MKLLLVQLTRNKQGQAMRAQQTIVVDQLRVGRGTDCKLFLADPRVALHHATIGMGGGTVVDTRNTCFIQADAGVVTIDGGYERAARLKPGQRLGIGPFELVVLEREAGSDVDLALSWELVDPLKDDAEVVKQNFKVGLRNTWLSKRWFSWVGILATLALFLAWPVSNALNPTGRGENAKVAWTPDAAWDPGELATSHHAFGKDCAQCHATPFVQTANTSCENCHKTIGWHFERNTKEAQAMHAAVFQKPGDETRCADCHRDHKGPMGLIRQDSPLCTDCHANIKAQLPKTASPNISDFQKDHPPFRLSMLVPGKSGAEGIVRVAQAATLKEKSNLKFPHDVHLNKDGVRGQNGKRVMECKNCHVPDETGSRFKPTAMKEHCQECHSLEFEPKASNRQVPHGSVEDVIATVNEFYSQAVLADTPIDVVFNEGARRPGERLNVADPARRLAALSWATKKADTITRELMEVRVCFSCHEINRVTVGEGKQQTVSWKVAPIAVTQHWLPKSRFPHVQHNPYECKQCHSVEKSKSSSDLAIPDLKNCQSCHAGNVTTTGMVRGTCETCHGFHVGGSRSGVPIPFPGSTPHDPKERAARNVAAAASGARP
jgi:predicted CXXCH cytochrome family protein